MGIPPIAEMAGRYTALMMAGRLPLHSNEQMQKDIEEDIEYDEWLFPYDAKRLPGIASHFETWTQWQREVGTDIRWLTLLFTDPLLLHLLLRGAARPHGHPVWLQFVVDDQQFLHSQRVR